MNTRFAFPLCLAIPLAFSFTLTGCLRTDGSTSLMTSAAKGNASRAERLIDKGADPNETNINDWTALMFAAREGHADVVKLLLDSGADPNLVSKRITGNTQAPYPNTTALREAIRNGHVAIANTLLDNGAEPDSTAFAIAGGVNDISLLEKMVAMGADPSAPSAGPDRYHPSALCVASVDGKAETVQWLLEKGVDPNTIALGCNPLRAAVNGGHLDVVKLLLAAGANPNVPSSPDRATAFLHAINAHTRSDRYDPTLEIVKALLANGADRNYRSAAPPFKNRNALEYAAAKRDESAARGANSRYNQGIAKKLGAIVELLEE